MLRGNGRMTLRRRLVLITTLCVALPLGAAAGVAPLVAARVMTNRAYDHLDTALAGAQQIVVSRQAALGRDVAAAAARLDDGVAADQVAASLVALGQADAAAVTGPGRPALSLPSQSVLQASAMASNGQTVVATIRLATLQAAMVSSASGTVVVRNGSAGWRHATTGSNLTSAVAFPGGVQLLASTPRSPVRQAERRWAVGAGAVLVAAVIVVILVGGRAIDTAARPLAGIVRWAESVVSGSRDADEPELSVDRLAQAVDRVTRDLRTQGEELDDVRAAFRLAVDRLGAVLGSTHDLSGIVAVLVDTALLAVPADAAVYYRLVAMPGELEAVDARGVVVEGLTLDGSGLAGYAALTLDTAVVPGPALLSGREPPAVAAVAVPVVSLGRPVGVLAAYGTSVARPFTSDEVHALQNIVRQAEVAIANVELHAQAQRDALTDGVTGLWNRRQFDLRCRDAQAAATRFGEPYALIVFDVDDFKRVNDDYDHFTGDAALIHLAAILRRSSREVDVVARWGGEEFTILVQRAGFEEACVVAERVRTQLRADPLVYKGEVVTFTVSAGVACYPDSGDSPRAVLAGADAALLRAKAAGKDRVERAARAASAPLVASPSCETPS
jgi:diguanylate cyclase (GGDEF)-like protein